MILDTTLSEASITLRIHEKFFANQSFPLSYLHPDTPFMGQYSKLGNFENTDLTFGFDGCFKFLKKSDGYFIYLFALPDENQFTVLRQMIMTVYVTTYYVTEEIYYNKEFFDDSIWDDQSLTFVILNGGRERCGYSIGGQVYPWLQKKLNLLDEDRLTELNSYVENELNKLNNYLYNRDIHYHQVSIKRHSFFIQVDCGGRWLSWEANTNANKPNAFDSHNIDHHSEQLLGFIAMLATNTWLRNN